MFRSENGASSSYLCPELLTYPYTAQNMLLTRVRPHVFLPGLGLLWGTFAALMATTQNAKQLTAVRFLLGFAEVCVTNYLPSRGFPPDHQKKMDFLTQTF